MEEDQALGTLSTMKELMISLNEQARNAKTIIIIHTNKHRPRALFNTVGHLLSPVSFNLCKSDIISEIKSKIVAPDSLIDVTCPNHAI